VSILWLLVIGFGGVILCMEYERRFVETPLFSPLDPAGYIITTKAYAEEATLNIDTDDKRVIADEVRAVFGTHAEDAFKVLQCENSALNPKAINTAGNYPEGSADVGVFQINEYWQKVGNRNFLTDYKINIRIAWNIYSRDGYSFKLWSCGKRLGI